MLVGIAIMNTENSRPRRPRAFYVCLIAAALAPFAMGACVRAAREEPLPPSYAPPAPQVGGIVGRRIVARGDYGYAPFEFLDSQGKPGGFNIELLTRVAAVMGLDVDIRLGPWEEVRAELEAGSIDMLAGMYRTPERDELVDFTIPHFISAYGVFAPKGSGVTGPVDISGLRVAVQSGDVGHDYLVRNGLGRELVVFRDWEDLFPALLEGKADCAVASMVQGMQHLRDRRFASLRQVGPPLVQEYYCMAVREGDAKLLAALNEGLNILKSSGEYDEIYQRWFGVLTAAEFTQHPAFRALMATLAALALLLAAAAAWTLTLRRTVALRTSELRAELGAREAAQAELHSSLEEAQELRLRAEAADRAKSAFLAGISHELRTPLHGMMGLSRLLEKTKLDSDQKTLLGHMGSSAIQLNRLISDLLDLTRAAGGKLSLRETDVNAGEFFSWLGATARSDAEAKGIGFRVKLDDPSRVFRADRERLGQVLLNLATNAIRHTVQGGVSVSASFGKAELRVEVADSGMGVEERYRSAIFEPFFSASEKDGKPGPAEPPTPGLGLGLAIARALCGLMGGELSYRPNDGGGSVFQLRIPVGAREQAPAADEDAACVKEAGGKRKGRSGPGCAYSWPRTRPSIPCTCSGSSKPGRRMPADRKSVV